MRKFLPLLVSLCVFGCPGKGMLSPVTNDLQEVLDHPVVQETLHNWSARADVTNPRTSFVVGTIFEVRADGMIIRGDIEGHADRHTDTQPSD